jgi:hypothetical protein
MTAHAEESKCLSPHIVIDVEGQVVAASNCDTIVRRHCPRQEVLQANLA